MTLNLAPTHPLSSGNAPRRAIIYCRISKDSAGKGLGVERQEESCRAFCVARGWDVADVIVENDTSASKGIRPLYAAMLSDVAQFRTADVIVSWAVDRLTRSPREIEDLISLSERTGITIATVNGELDLSSDQGRLVGRILGSVARAEVERKGERQRAAYRQSQSRGEVPRGRILGYGKGGVIIEDEAELVRDLFAQFVAGRGVSGIVKELNAAAVPSSRGTKWSRNGLTWLLRNPRYIGKRARLVGPPKGALTAWEMVSEGKWPAIIDPETFVAAQARFTKSLSTSKRVGPHKVHLGSGLVACGVCGSRVVSYYKHYTRVDGTRITSRHYKCATSTHLARLAEPIDELIIAKVVGYLRENDLAALMVDDRDADDSRRLRERAVTLQATLDDLPRAIREDDLSLKLAGATEREIETELAGIDAQRVMAGRRSPLALVAGAKDPGLAWLSLRDADLAAAQAVVEAVATITLLPGKRGRAEFDPDTVRIVFLGEDSGDGQ